MPTPEEVEVPILSIDGSPQEFVKPSFLRRILQSEKFSATGSHMLGFEQQVA